MSGHHHHHHSHQTPDRIGWAFLLNAAFTLIEFVGGYLTGSTAIMADAVHDLGDSLSLGMGYVLARLSLRHASERFTYGYRRLSLLAALINALVLVAGSIGVLSLSIPRLLAPQMPHTEGMLGLAVLGVVVNGYAAWQLSKGASLNEKVLNWHLLEDVLGWVAVLVVSLVLMVWPLAWLDPALSIVFTGFILINVLRHLRSTLVLFLQGVPDPALVRAVEQKLRALPAVEDLHHLHLWSLDGEHHVLTVHLVVDSMLDAGAQLQLKQQVQQQLAPFGLEHTTVELEFPDEDCRDKHAG